MKASESIKFSERNESEMFSVVCSDHMFEKWTLARILLVSRNQVKNLNQIFYLLLIYK
jgi:hypothetical protein